MDPRCESRRNVVHMSEAVSELSAQVLHDGTKIVDDRTQLINDRIGPRPRSLQERARHLGYSVHPFHKRTHVFSKVRHEGTHIFGQVRSDLLEARGLRRSRRHIRQRRWLLRWGGDARSGFSRCVHLAI